MIGDDSDIDDEEEIDRNNYSLTSRDIRLLAAARSLLKKVLRSSQARPAELVSVAKLLHAIERLPKVSNDLHVEVLVASPARKFGQVKTDHYWEVKLEDGDLQLHSGGNYVHQNTGHDSFTTMTWEIYPDGEADFSDYLSSLDVVPDACSFGEGIAGVVFASGGYTLDVTDDDNPLLAQMKGDEEEGADPKVGAAANVATAQSPFQANLFDALRDDDEEEEEEDDDVEDDEDEDDEKGADSQDKQIKFSVTPVDAAELALARQIDQVEVHRQEPVFAFGAKRCDACGTPLDSRGLYVDGKLKDGNGWANLCVPCFSVRGAGIAWGRGQLYARQPDGRWRLVAGFAPPD